MYAKSLGLKQEPFSIAPDPRYLFMSERHREALAHLLYGIKSGGGFVLLTGEIGAGKTTVCRCFMEQIPKRCNVAYIFNPKLNAIELLQSVCKEFGIAVGSEASAKQCVDALNEFLLRTHGVGQNNLLIIDEAQNLSAEVLEQLRLLTNLETHERKLLQIVLIGQPELRDMVASPALEQLAQRVIARYHLGALTEEETRQYVRHRLAVAGWNAPLPFDRMALVRIYKLSRGVPRRINLLCDRALLGAYAKGQRKVDEAMAKQAGEEVFGVASQRPAWLPGPPWVAWAVVGALAVGLVALGLWAWPGRPGSSAAAPPVAQVGSASQGMPAPAKVPEAARPGLDAGRGAGAGAVAAPPALEPRLALQQALRDERAGTHELAALWGAVPAEGEPCAALQRQGLWCHRATLNLSQLRQLDRPVLLKLQGSEADGSVLLLGLSGQRARLAGAQGPVDWPLVHLAQHWRGEMLTMWRAPNGYAGTMAPGSRSPAVAWVAGTLARAASQPAPAQARFDAAMKAQLQSYQVLHGLQPDGVAGATTLMQLNRSAGVAEPRLQSMP